MGAHAIDISKYQNSINWNEVKMNNKDLKRCLIKACEGVNAPDPLRKSHAMGAKSIGLLTSYYHFATLNKKDVINDATEEAKYFLKTVSELPLNDYPLVLDIEREIINLTPQEFYTWMKTFFSVLDNACKKYMIYGGKYFLNDNLPPNHGFGAIPLWVANYSAINNPPLPKGWTHYALWQYTQEGQVTGIKGHVDLSRANPNYTF